MRLRTLATTMLVIAATACAPEAGDGRRMLVKQVLASPPTDVAGADASADAAQQHPSAAPAPDPDKKELAADSPEALALFRTLETRFSKKSPFRPAGVTFADVKKALAANPAALWSLNRMEETGGEPDVIAVEGGTFVFADVSEKSPRRNLNYDEAQKMADEMGVQMMDEDTYIKLQSAVQIDTKTWSLLLKDANSQADNEAPHGFCDQDGIQILSTYTHLRYGFMGWRATLDVPLIE